MHYVVYDPHALCPMQTGVSLAYTSKALHVFCIGGFLRCDLHAPAVTLNRERTRGLYVSSGEGKSSCVGAGPFCLNYFIFLKERLIQILLHDFLKKKYKYVRNFETIAKIIISIFSTNISIEVYQSGLSRIR